MYKDFTVLFVEDDKNTRMFMNIFLKEVAKEVYIAKDGVEGLQKYKQYKPDVVITDISMPEMDGLTMAKEIKKLDPNQYIIIMSAYDERDNLLQTLEIGVNYFLPKPIDTEILFQKLQYITSKIEEEHNKMHCDELTKLPNKYCFDHRIKEFLNKANRKGWNFTVFYIDLDNFEQINQKCGKKTGDDILYQVSQNIKNIIRVEDFLARLNSDEFVLIIEDINPKNIEKLANKILNAANLKTNCKNITTSASIGISTYPNDSENIETLLDLAYEAMRHVKENNKNNFLHISNIK